MKGLSLLVWIAGLVLCTYMAWDFVKPALPEVKSGASGNALHASSYTAALEQAEKDGKPVLLIFTASWCGPCQAMKKEVYPSQQVQSVADRLVWVTLDVDKGSNRPLAQKYGVQGIPCLVIVDSKGREKSRSVGGRSPADLARWLHDNS